jgi:hypothetical protein
MLVRHQVVSLSGSHALATARVCLDHLQLLHHHNLGVSARENSQCLSRVCTFSYIFLP